MHERHQVRSRRRRPAVRLRHAAAILVAGLLLGPVLDAGGQNRGRPVLPSEFDTLAPPEAGGAYADPAFGTIVRRLTDSTGLTAGGLVPEYSQTSSFNRDDTFLILFSSVFGSYHLFRGDGRFVRDLRQIPGGLAEPRWSRLNPRHLYFHTANRILRLDVSNGQTEPIAAFPEYASIDFGRGQGDVSDNERITVVGDRRFIFVYDLATRQRFGTLDRNQAPVSGTPFDAVTIAKDGNSFVVGYAAAGGRRAAGMEQYDLNANFVVQLQNAPAHYAMGRDVDGSPVMFATNSPTDPQQPPGCDNGVVKIALDGSARRSCLQVLAWAMEKHLSAHGNDGWVYLSTYQPLAQPVPPGSDPTDRTRWHPFTNEIFRIRADGSRVERFVHHRSRADTYWRQPHANISISGNKLVYGSDFRLPGVDANYADTYLIDLTLLATGVPTPLQPTGEIVARGPAYSWSRAGAALRYRLTVRGPLGVVHDRWYPATQVCTGGICSVASPPVRSLRLGPHTFSVTAENAAGEATTSAPSAFVVSFRSFRPSGGLLAPERR